jgi:hypothetical protein
MADNAQIVFLQQQIATAQKQLAALQDVQNNKTTYTKKANQLEAVNNPNNSFSEPTPAYAPRYPYNNAKASESGHLMEFDDTPGAERVSIAHRTGTYYEIGPDGSKTEKIFNDNYQIIMKDDYIHIMGKATVSVQGECKVYVQGNAQLQVDGDVNWKVGGNMNMAIDGMFTATASDFNIVGNINQVGDLVTTGNILNQGNISSAKNIQATKDFVGKGNLSVTGTGTYGGDVTAAGISLDNHVHSDPQGGTTGKPQ